jgi:hypothetical protein
MKRFLACALSCAGLAWFSPPIPAQEGKLVVVNTSSKELKRTAHRLRIPVDRLKNAREALSEATELARRPPVPQHLAHQLGNFWIELNRAKAEAALNELITRLRLAALSAATADEYLEATSSAFGLLNSLSQVDPDGAVDWRNRWPKPSASFDGIESRVTELERQLKRTMVYQMVNSKPDAALALVSSGADGTNTDFGLRAPVASRLINSGRKEDGLRLIDQTIAEFAGIKPTQDQWHGYVSFIQQVTYAAPDRFLEAFQVLAQAGPPRTGLPGASHTYAGPGDQVVALDEQESMALNLLRGLNQRPELMLKALESMPSLKSKVEQLGGIDSALNPREMVTRPAPYGSEFHRGPRRMSSDAAVAAEGGASTPDAIYAKVRGKIARNPDFVRRTLADAFTGPEEADKMLQLAMISSSEDPDLSSLAIEMARPLIRRVEPPQRRMHLYQQLVTATRECEGEVDAELIKEGFIVADELREAEKEMSANVPVKPGDTAADYFERFLLSVLARDNFPAAIRYARSMPDESTKLSALLQIVQGCREH